MFGLKQHWKSDIISTVIALGIFFLAVQPTINLWKQLFPIQIEQEVFTARVHVPDFVVGDDPLVDYENTKFQDFRGIYTVDVKTLEGKTVCVGSNIKRHPNGTPYDVEDKVDPSESTFNWYVDTLIDPLNDRGKLCSQVIKPGRYYITTVYDITLDDGTELLYRPPDSNVFTVHPQPNDPLTRR